MSQAKKPLAGKVAVVTGASRGGGKGVALELGAAGAIVYVTGRSTRSEPPPSYANFLEATSMASMPGTIEDTAEEVTAAGGRGIPIKCDHSSVVDVRALFARVEEEQGRVDLLVNNAWGGHETFTAASLSAPFWDQPIEHWGSMFDRGVRNHVLTCQVAAPIFVRQKGGLIVTTTFWDRGRYLKGNFFYDLAKAAMTRVAFAVAEELRPHGVASIAVSPGWMRTELVLAGHQADESTWKERPALAGTESPRYLGRGIVALATDLDVMRKSGTTQTVGALALEYGFTDVDGRVVPPFELG